MKKILLGILVLIPIIILGVVTLVGSIASIAAHIGVESVKIQLNPEYENNNSLDIVLSDVADKVINLEEYFSVEVLPTKATNPSLEWEILDLHIFDKEYESSYKQYLNNVDDIGVVPVNPPVFLVDENGNETEKNSTGKLRINTYCSFTLRVMAEQHSDQIIITAVGYDVEKIELSLQKELTVGEMALVETLFTPIDSMVERIEWGSSDETIVSVDQNGIVHAKKDGTAVIKCKAYKIASPDTFVENELNVVVKKAVTSYGNEFYIHTPTITLDRLGIDKIVNITGGTVLDGIVTLEDSTIEIITNDGSAKIHKCNENDITINEIDILSSDKGFVMPVSKLPVKLSASYLSSLKDSSITPVWESSDENIATIDNNGVLTTVNTGLVLITAKFDGQTAEIQINVQNKISSLIIINSDNFYKVGLASETVFASHKYKDISVDDAKIQNSIDITIKGEPLNATIDGKKAFYNAFIFEIQEGNNYAKFDKDKANKLVFLDSLKGAGRQTIVVKVSAKYPRYSSFDSYTTSYLHINAIYGVEVNNFLELKNATIDQKDFAYEKDNRINTTNNPRASYAFTNNVGSCRPATISSKNTLAICLSDDIKIDKSVKFSNSFNLCLYGSLYGNNHMVSAEKEQYESDSSGMFLIAWSDVVVSNVIIRANELHDVIEISDGEETAKLRGQCLDVYSKIDSSKMRLLNVQIEYSVLENARCSGSVYSSEATYKGCIIRNMSNIGMYVYNCIRIVGNDKYLNQCDVTYINMIFSNCLGTACDFDTCCFEIKGDGANDKYNFANTKEENDKFIMDNIVKKDLNGSFVQKGFLDIYNWQSTENVSFIKTGDDSLDDILQFATSSIIGTDPGLIPFRYRYKNVDYFHLGFMLESMDQGNIGNPLTLNEQIWMTIDMTDDRFVPFHMSDVQDATFGQLLSKFGLTIYAYKNTSDLKPSSSYAINSKLIEKLHSKY